MPEPKYPKYDKSTEWDAPVPKNPQASSGTPGSKSPCIDRPAPRRNKAAGPDGERESDKRPSR